MRVVRALVERMGYAEPVVDYALDTLFGALDARTLRATIEGELGSFDALEGFVARAGRPDVTYRGVERVAIVSSDTTIGVALPSLAYALCAGSSAIVKDRNDRLIAEFSRTLAEERPELGDRIEAGVWDGSDDALSRAALERADTVVAFGRNDALRAIRAHLHAEARFVGYGHRTSVGYVEREALASAAPSRDAARGIARDALLYDGQGCLSLHAAFVERGGACDAVAFARLVSAACDETALEFPPAYGADAELAAYGRAAAFRAAQGSGAFYGGNVAPHAVALDPPRDAPPPLVRRLIALYTVDAPDDALAFVRRHGLPLEAVAFASPAPREDALAFALASGASRIATLGSLQTPPFGGEHGGVGRILPFVRAIYRG